MLFRIEASARHTRSKTSSFQWPGSKGCLQERAKAHAVRRIKKTLLYAFLSYPVVGFAGCFVRQLNEVHAGNIHNFKNKGFESYSTEAIFVPIVILVVGAIIAFTQLNSTKD